MGLFAQVGQIVMFREMLAMCRGTEVFFGIVLAAGLGWAALGALVAGLVERWRVRRSARAWPRRAWTLAAGLFSLNGLLLVGQIALARHRSMAWGGADELTFLEAAATAGLATGPLALLCGAEFVLALHAARAEAFARLYQADAWGAVVGGLAFTFLLVGWLDPVTLGPALNVMLGLVVLVSGGRGLGAAGVAIGLVAAAAVWLGDLDGRLHRRRWRALHPGYALEASEDSRYGQLAVLRHPRVAQHSVYLDGGLVKTLPPPGAPVVDERNRALFLAAQHPAPKRVLLVGGALGRLPAELLRMGIERVDALELDPELLRLARCFGQPSVDARVRFHLVDGRYFIQRRAGSARYDLVVVDLPAPLSAFVNRYFTVEFFREARAVLDDGGVLITSVMAAANYPGETVGRLSACVLRTLRAVFAEVLVAPGDRHIFVAAARPGIVSLSPALLGRRIARRGIVLPDVDPAYHELLPQYYQARLENLIVASQVEQLRADLEAIPAPINSDSRPITYQYALLVWNQITSARPQARDPGIRGGTNALFRAALRFRFAHGLMLPAVLVVGGAGFVALSRCLRRVQRLPKPRPDWDAALAAAFAAALCGTVAEAMLLLMFPSAYGHLRSAVGAILMPPGLIVLGIALLVVLSQLWRRRGCAATHCVAAYGVLATAFATGLFGMAAEIILLFAFQSAYGYAYAQVGAIVASFMVGLALGARAGAPWARRPGALVVTVVVMMAYCLVVPGVLRGLARGGAAWALCGGFFALVFAAGFLDGATFPALVGALRRVGSPRPGAWVYAADLAGAALGALATGALLVPTLGQAAALGLVAATLAAALLVMAWGPRGPNALPSRSASACYRGLGFFLMGMGRRQVRSSSPRSWLT